MKYENLEKTPSENSKLIINERKQEIKMYKIYYSIAVLFLKEVDNVFYYLMDHIITCKESKNGYSLSIEELEKETYKIFNNSKEAVIDKYRIEKIDVAEVVKIKE